MNAKAIIGIALVAGFVAGHFINHFAALVIVGERIAERKGLLFRHLGFVF